MAKFVVIVTETHELDVEADDEAQIRHWYDTEGADWVDRHAETVSLDDKIVSIKEYT